LPVSVSSTIESRKTPAKSVFQFKIFYDSEKAPVLESGNWRDVIEKSLRIIRQPDFHRAYVYQVRETILDERTSEDEGKLFI